MKAIAPLLVTILCLHLAGAVEADSPAYDGSGLFAHELLLLRHWSFGFSSYSGTRVPSSRRYDDSPNAGYGVQIGAHWSLPGHIRLSLEMPYALERISPLGVGNEPHTDAESAYPEPRVAGMLTLKLHF